MSNTFKPIHKHQCPSTITGGYSNAMSPPKEVFAGFAESASAFSSGRYSPVLNSKWVADTGASAHMTPHRHWFKEYTPYKIAIRLADGKLIMSAGIGTMVFYPKGVDGIKSLEFEHVLHVPDLRSNLLSVLYLTQRKNLEATITRNKIYFKRDDQLLFTASVDSCHNAYLDGNTQTQHEVAARASTCKMDLTLWHRRFSHLNHGDVKQLISKGLVTGIRLDSNVKPDPICEPCIAGKQHRVVNKSATSRATKPLELVHTDVHGPMPVQTCEGYKYWICFVDDATRLVAITPLKRKSDAFEAFKVYKTTMENQTVLNCMILQSHIIVNSWVYLTNIVGCATVTLHCLSTVHRVQTVHTALELCVLP